MAPQRYKIIANNGFNIVIFFTAPTPQGGSRPGSTTCKGLSQAATGRQNPHRNVQKCRRGRSAARRFPKKTYLWTSEFVRIGRRPAGSCAGRTIRQELPIHETTDSASLSAVDGPVRVGTRLRKESAGRPDEPRSGLHPGPGRICPRNDRSAPRISFRRIGPGAAVARPTSLYRERRRLFQSRRAL